MRAGLLVALFVLSLFGGRLVQLQGLDPDALARQAQAKLTDARVLLAHRGDIVDANGAVLATSVDRRDILVDQTLVALPRRSGGRVVSGIPAVAADLAPLLGLPVAAVQAKLTGRSKGAIIARDVPTDVATRILRLAIKGLDTRNTTRRVYPNGALAGNVLGFVSALGTTFGGIEKRFDDTLTGSNGKLVYEQGKDGTPIPNAVSSETDPMDGGTVQLTLVRDLQWQAQQAIAAQVAATGSESGSVAIIDTRTGEVLALATAPGFDPNTPGRANPADTGDRPLLDVFEPGSTAKVVTLAAALEEKVATPLSQVTVPGSLHRADRQISDAESHGTEHLTVAGVLAQSSNIGTVMTGEQVPAQTLWRYQQAFGLGRPTGIGLAESGGILAPASAWNGSQRYTVMYGQGLSVTTLQAAQVFATLANDGVRIAPSIVAGWTDADGRRHSPPAPATTRVVSPQTALAMRQMMEGVVVKGGTAVKAAIPGYLVAGKTGTASRVVNGRYDGSYTASFIGMAPADKPALVVAVILQRPTNGHFGGDVAAPVFRDLMSSALALRGVPPSNAPAAQIPTSW